MKSLDKNLDELEREFQDKLKDHYIPQPNKNWIPKRNS